jgi:hypothetical protein
MLSATKGEWIGGEALKIFRERGTILAFMRPERRLGKEKCLP